MITEQEFLKALDIVRAYQKQVNDLAETTLPQKMQPLKKGDIIIFTKVNNLSEQIEVGKEYKVCNFSYRVGFSEFDKYIYNKFGEDYTKNFTKRQWQEFYQNQIPISGLEYEASIRIYLESKKYREIKTGSGYEYKLVNSK